MTKDGKSEGARPENTKWNIRRFQKQCLQFAHNYGL